MFLLAVALPLVTKNALVFPEQLQKDIVTKNVLVFSLSTKLRLDDEGISAGVSSIDKPRLDDKQVHTLAFLLSSTLICFDKENKIIVFSLLTTQRLGK